MGHESHAQASAPDDTAGTPEDNGKPKLKRKDYDKALRKLQTELCTLQDWVKSTVSGSSSSSKDATQPARVGPSGR